MPFQKIWDELLVLRNPSLNNVTGTLSTFNAGGTARLV